MLLVYFCSILQITMTRNLCSIGTKRDISVPAPHLTPIGSLRACILSHRKQKQTSPHPRRAVSCPPRSLYYKKNKTKQNMHNTVSYYLPSFPQPVSLFLYYLPVHHTGSSPANCCQYDQLRTCTSCRPVYKWVVSDHDGFGTGAFMDFYQVLVSTAEQQIKDPQGICVQNSPPLCHSEFYSPHFAISNS